LARSKSIFVGRWQHGGVGGRDDPEDAQKLAEIAGSLADAIDAAIPGWVERCVDQRLTAWAGSADPEVLERARAAGVRARAEVGASVRQLLAEDVDEQRTNPLTLLRHAVRYPTEVLRGAGVPPVRRDEFAERSFPDDIYDLSPTSFADVDPSLHEPGLMWGAAKAHVHLRRHRRG
jgi:hypothetical protein